jgi:hypothetical protein
MKITIQYESQTIMPEELRICFEKTKEHCCEVSCEPDKTIIFLDNLKNEIMFWILDKSNINK